jgi:DNA repair ATPase RecN
MIMSDTPRTDDLLMAMKLTPKFTKEDDTDRDRALNLARTLERELKALSESHDAGMDWMAGEQFRSDYQTAKEMRLANDGYRKNISDLQAERDQLKAEVERLNGVRDQLIKFSNSNADCVAKANNEAEQWHDMAREAAHCCNEVAAYGTCDCDLKNDPNPCVFCEANKVVARFNAMEKGTK